MSYDLTPLQVCEALFGGPEQISLVMGYTKTAPLNWRHASNSRAAGDFPSTIIQRMLLDHSDARNLGLTAEHLIRGASREDVDAILSQRLGCVNALSATAAE